MKVDRKLDKAIELLEKVYYKVYVGASFENNKLSLIEDLQAKREIAEFVKSVKKDTKLKIPKLISYHLFA